MKMTKREKVTVAVFIVLVILAAGAFLLVLPEYNRIEVNRSELEEAKVYRDQIYQNLTREGTIDQELETASESAKRFASFFYNDMTTFEADKIFREIIENAGLETDSLSIGQFSTSTLTVSEYTNAAVMYPLKEYAGYSEDKGLSDVDLSAYPLQFDEEGKVIVSEELQGVLDEYKSTLKEYVNNMLSLTSQTLGTITANFNITCTNEEYLKFLDYVHNLERATYVNGANINCEDNFLTFSDTSADENADGSESDGENSENTEKFDETGETQTVEPQIVNEFTYNVQMTLYCVTELQGTE